MKKLIPTNKIIEINGISSRTLKRYSDLGIIDKPVFKCHGDGPGVSNYWKPSVTFDLTVIKHLKRLKKTVSEIQTIMKKGGN